MNNFDLINWDTLQVSAITSEDRPFVVALEFMDGTPLTDEELDSIHEILFEDQVRRVKQNISNDDGDTVFILELEDSDFEFEFELDLDGEEDDAD